MAPAPVGGLWWGSGVPGSLVGESWFIAFQEMLIDVRAVVGWNRRIGIGVMVAAVAARRGHDAGPLVALGLLFGPLLAVTAVAPDDSARVGSEMLAPGHDRGGKVAVLVVVLDEPMRTAEALPFLQSLGRPWS
jgi:hypothetical protein